MDTFIHPLTPYVSHVVTKVPMSFHSCLIGVRFQTGLLLPRLCGPFLPVRNMSENTWWASFYVLIV